MKTEDMIEGIRHYVDLENLADYVTDGIYQLFEGHISFYLWDKKKKNYLLQSQRGLLQQKQKSQSLNRKSAIIKWFSSHWSSVLTEDSLENSKSTYKDTLLQEFKNLKSTLCLAIRAEDGIVRGILSLGKKNNQSFSKKELKELERIIDQTSSTIDKIKIYLQLVEDRVYTNIGKIALQIAHDLNSPLNNINVFLQLLAQEPKWQQDGNNDLSNKFFTIAQEEMQRAIDIVKNLLLYAHPMRTKTEPIEINKLIRQVLGTFQESLQSKNISLILQFTDGLIIPGESELLFRVFLNLICNAIKAVEAEKRRELTISTNQDRGWVRISLSDTGKGISREIKDNLFAPFVACGKEKGVGLGLSIVERILMLHGGDIHVKAEDDRGNTLVIHLPLEKRRQSRKMVDSIEVYQLPQNELLLAQDISITGLRLSCQKYYSSDQLIKLFINLPDESKPIIALSKVVWWRKTLGRKGWPYDIGLEFIDISKENSQRINEWIKTTKEIDSLQSVG